MHAEQRRARLDIVGRATSDGAAHVLSCGYRGPYPDKSVLENFRNQAFQFSIILGASRILTELLQERLRVKTTKNM